MNRTKRGGQSMPQDDFCRNTDRRASLPLGRGGLMGGVGVWCLLAVAETLRRGW